MDDISLGAEPLPIPAVGTPVQLDNLFHSFRTYITDSVSIHGTPLSDFDGAEEPDGPGRPSNSVSDDIDQIYDLNPAPNGNGPKETSDGRPHSPNISEPPFNVKQNPSPKHGAASCSGSDSESEDVSYDNWACSCGVITDTGSEGSRDDDIEAETAEWLCTVQSGICDCVSAFGNFYSVPQSSNPLHSSGTSLQTLNLDALPERLPLVECSSSCACAKRCADRVTQRGVRIPMTIEPSSSGIGFGLFYTPSSAATSDLDLNPDLILKRATFICLYAGEYLTDSEARSRWQAQQLQPSAERQAHEGQGNYILSLRLPGQNVHIDPRYKGNVGRFLNHSCDPNCIILPVRWGGGSKGWYRAAIFTKRAINSAEELTFDYANASGSTSAATSRASKALSRNGPDTNLGRTKCLCGASICRGWMPFDEFL